jgi:hypothetical protein
MRARSWAAAGLVVLAIGWGGAGYLATKPTDFHDYRTAAIGAAQSAYTALTTAELTGRAVLADRIPGPYAASMLDDCRSALAGAAKRFTAVAPPDPRTTAMRATLGPLLSSANSVLGDIETALDAGPLQERLDAARAIADDLDAFIEAHR